MFRRTTVFSVCFLALAALGPAAPRVHGGDLLIGLTASDVAELLEWRVLTSEQYARAVLDRADRLQPWNAFVTRTSPEVVLEAARQSDRRRARGRAKGPLDGVPFVIKDNFDSADLPTTSGTPALSGNRPAANAAVLQSLLDGGAILIGKANMHELAFGVTSNNPATGAVHNPYDPDKIPGGSSGGSAVAVASGIVPIALGSDTAGSVRIPAALSGTAGFVPSPGRYPRDGLMVVSNTQDRVGTLARSVRDLVLLDRVLVADKGHVVRPARLRGLRLGVDRANFANNLDPAVSFLFERALTELRARGVVLVEVPVLPRPDFLATIGSLRQTIGFYEAPINTAHYLSQNARPSLTIQQLAAGIATPEVSLIFSNFLLPGARGAITPDAYHQALTARDRLREAYRTYFKSQQVAGVLLPTTVLPARPIGQDAVVDLNGTPVPTTLIYSQNTVPASYAGLTSLSVPIGLTDDGLPVGIELDGAEGDDEKVLGIGLMLEHVFGRLPAPTLP
jgi:Asp-tRNA(Asn)/Glu-tRNA(Gln) amidotransferase A subunit family amidase